MSDNPIRDYWLSHQPQKDSIPRLQCADGFIMSVQASGRHCCEPRAYLEDGDYQAWEVGFPSDAEPLLTPYGSPLSRQKDQIFDFVPTQIINGIIAKHGGIAGSVKTTRRKRRAS